MTNTLVCSEADGTVICKSKNKNLIELTEGYYDEQSSFWICDKPVTVDTVNDAIKKKGDVAFFENSLGILGCTQIEFLEDNCISKNDLEY